MSCCEEKCCSRAAVCRMHAHAPGIFVAGFVAAILNLACSEAQLADECNGAGTRPVLVVPGFQGSPLFDASQNFSLVWLNASDALTGNTDAEALALPLEWDGLTQARTSVGTASGPDDDQPSLDNPAGEFFVDRVRSSCCCVVGLLADASCTTQYQSFAFMRQWTFPLTAHTRGGICHVQPSYHLNDVIVAVSSPHSGCVSSCACSRLHARQAAHLFEPCMRTSVYMTRQRLQLYSNVRDVASAWSHPSDASIDMFYTFAWDWRRDLWEAAEGLRDRVDFIYNRTGCRPILVGHSYGGRVIYIALARFGEGLARLTGGVLYAATAFFGNAAIAPGTHATSKCTAAHSDML